MCDPRLPNLGKMSGKSLPQLYHYLPLYLKLYTRVTERGGKNYSTTTKNYIKKKKSNTVLQRQRDVMVIRKSTIHTKIIHDLRTRPLHFED